MINRIFTFTGALLMGLPYLVFGIAHFVRPEMFRSIQPPWMGGHLFWTFLVGALMLLCGLSVITGKMGRVGALTLAGLLLLLTFGIYIPLITSGDPAQLTEGIEGAFKNVGLIGGFVFYAAYRKASWS